MTLAGGDVSRWIHFGRGVTNGGIDDSKVGAWQEANVPGFERPISMS